MKYKENYGFKPHSIYANNNKISKIVSTKKLDIIIV